MGSYRSRTTRPLNERLISYYGNPTVNTHFRLEKNIGGFDDTRVQSDYSVNESIW